MGKKTHSYYDASQTVFMVEEILNLLIVIICERANVSGMSILDKIRREIVHNLCLGSSAYSDLTKRIPERITEHPEFDRILADVAHFKSPDGVNDHGSYELNNEYFASVDTYFWHFSRNNREEAESILKTRWKKANPNAKEEDFFILPKNVPIAPGPFRHLGSFLQSPVFVQMLTYALWNTFAGDNHKSDTILDQIMYLILLALTDENSEDVSNYGQGKFYDYICSLYFTIEMPHAATTNESQPKETMQVSLFNVMTILYKEEQYTEVLSRFNWIFEQLEQKGSEITRSLVNRWRHEHNAQLQADAQKKQDEGESGVVELSEIEKKKQAAKERQLKIMAQFAQAQSQFMEKNEYLYEDEEDDAFVDAPDTFSSSNATGNGSEEEIGSENLHQFCSYPTGTCIVCQEDVNDRSLPYGLLGLIQTSNIMRETPMDDSSLFNDIYNMGSNLDVEWQDKQCLPDDADTVPGFPAQLHKTGLYASSCGHLMHIKCFEVYCTSIDSRHSSQLTRNHPENRSRKEFMCPLCKSLGNALLPVFWKGKKESFPGVLVKAYEADYATFYKTGVMHIVNKLKQTIIASSRHAQMKKSAGRETSTTSRMKDVMAHLLPDLPLMGTPGAPNPTATATATATMNTGTGRDWTTFGLPARLPLPTPLDNNIVAPGLDTTPPVPAAINETNPTLVQQQQSPNTQDGHMMNINAEEEDGAEHDVEAMLIQNALNSDSLPLPNGQLGPFENDTLHGTAMVSAPFIKKSYQRLLDVLGIIYQEICTDDYEREMSTAAENVDMLWGVMGYTIAGVEIASRGASRSAVAQEHITTHTLFDQIPPQTQMLLRIFSDTVMAYTTLMCPGAVADNNKSTSSTASISMARVSMFSLGRMRQMFEITVDDVANLPAGPSEKIMLYDNVPILQDDPFMILTELSLHLVPMTQADIFPFVRTLLLAEFAKTAIGLLQYRLSPDTEHIHQTAASEPSHNITAAKSFAFSLMGKLRFTPLEVQIAFDKFGSDAAFCALLKFFVLPFLRRTLILLIVRFGLIVPPSQTDDNNTAADEFERLLNILHLPSFADFIRPTPMTESLLHYWCSQHVRESERRIQLEKGVLTSMSANRLIHISLNLPTPIYLVALPKRLDRLFDESMKRVCQKCGTVPSDPALCLFCGTFVCAQSFCCAEDEEGECNLHTLE